MDMDSDQVSGIDRAQLFKLGTAAFAAAAAATLSARPANADYVRPAKKCPKIRTGHAITLDYEQTNLGPQTIPTIGPKAREKLHQPAAMSNVLDRVRITDDALATAGATLVFELDNAISAGHDENTTAHCASFGHRLYVALWLTGPIP